MGKRLNLAKELSSFLRRTTLLLLTCGALWLTLQSGRTRVLRTGERKMSGLSLKSLFFQRLALTVAVVLLGQACGLDGLTLTEFSRQDHIQPPDPQPQIVTGTVALGAGAQVGLLTGEGKPIGIGEAIADAEGKFAITLEPTTTLTNALLHAHQGRRQWFALVPYLPAQSSVYNPVKTFDLADLTPGMPRLDAGSTAMTLLLVAKLRQENRSLNSFAQQAMIESLQTLSKAVFAGQPALVKFGQMVERITILADTNTSKDITLPFDLSSKGSLLRGGFLAQNAVDYDGDGQFDATTGAFDTALTAAIASFLLSSNACYEVNLIRVVIEARLVKGAKDGNCEAIDSFQWADELATSKVFLTGQIHKDTKICQGNTRDSCLMQSEVDAANAKMGNFVPNLVEMYDDGSNGDATAGDGIWTIALDLPYWATSAADSTATGARIGYKFTFGKPKQGWTGSEEFPGNSRLLELIDVNGDHLITRLDEFKDETTNKDKSNQLHAGCGVTTWPAASKDPLCVSDTRERMVDLDGDCKIDGWPQFGSVAPLTVDCPKP